MNRVDFDPKNANPDGQTLGDWMKENDIENMDDVLKKEDSELDKLGRGESDVR